MRHGKNVQNARAKVDRDQKYTLAEAMILAKEASFVKFDEAVDLAFNLNVDPRHADQMIRGATVLPNGLGRSVRVCVFAKGEKAQEARDAGADVVGDEDLTEKIKGGWLEFDKCIATPDMMRYVGQVGKILGPRGLMPNPKVGTVTMDVSTAVQEAKSGRVEFRADKSGLVHVSVGRVSFDAEKLTENAQTLVNMIQKQRPASVKGTYMMKLAVSTTMGPGIGVDVATLSELDE
jgi:large subunit ribosomal protein L1